MKEEMLRILKMVEEGKLSSEKAAEMINLLNNRPDEQLINKKGKILRISVDSPYKDAVRVNVPIGFVKNMIKAVGPGYIQKVINQFAQNESEGLSSQSAENSFIHGFGSIDGIDVNLILYAIENDLDGEIVNIETTDGTKVYIGIEQMQL